MGFSRKNTGVGCHFLLQEIFPTQRSNPGLPHGRQALFTVWATRKALWSAVYLDIILRAIWRLLSWSDRLRFDQSSDGEKLFWWFHSFSSCFMGWHLKNFMWAFPKVPDLKRNAENQRVWSQKNWVFFHVLSFLRYVISGKVLLSH